MPTTETITRKEHLEFCKQRALEYVKKGDLANAWGSFISDMSKHSETKDHGALGLGAMMILGGHLATNESMEKFINDFQ